MKKIAALIKFDNAGIDDVPLIMIEHNAKISKSYNDVLQLTIEHYLGRKINLKVDGPRLSSAESQNGDRQYFYDGVLIGTMKCEFGYNNDDFAMHKLSYSITFTPVQTSSDTPPHSS